MILTPKSNYFTQ